LKLCNNKKFRLIGEQTAAACIGPEWRHR